MTHSRIHRRAFLAGASALIGGGAFAQQPGAWPSRTIRIVVPYTPGGITDVVSRMVGEQLAAALGQQVVIENKPGANSILGADAVAKSEPDGHTLGMVIGAHAANATLYAGKLPFDVVESFAPVSLVGVAPLVMAASPKLPVKSLAELIAYAKAHPGKVNFGSSGVGSAAHLTTEDLKRRVGLDMVHVPYRGTGPALTGLMTGDIGVLVDTMSSLKPQIDANGVTAIAIASERRSPVAPAIPTVAEAGLPDFVASTWTLLIAPARTPPQVVERVAGEVGKAVRGEPMRAKLEALGIDPVGGTPGEATEFLKTEVAKWGAVIRAANVKLD